MVWAQITAIARAIAEACIFRFGQVLGVLLIFAVVAALFAVAFFFAWLGFKILGAVGGVIGLALGIAIAMGIGDVLFKALP